MKRRKKIFIIVSVLLAVVAALFYLLVGSREYKEIENRTQQMQDSDNDSTTLPSDKTTPVDIGAKPEINPENGSIKIVEDFIKANAKNPGSFEFLEWSDVSVEKGYWKVRCKYKGISSFNAEVTTNAWFYIRNHKVVYTKIISKI